MGKRVLVLSYWGLHDGLTQAAVLPHVELLQQVAGVLEVILVTIEREGDAAPDIAALPGLTHLRHFMLLSRNYRSNIVNKINDFLSFPRQLRRIVVQEQIDAVVASGALAGALAYKVWQKTKVPFYVLFEPHAAYMLENKVWHKWDPRYVFQQKWEAEQLKAASGLIVVSEKYRQNLLSSSFTLAFNMIVTGRNPVKLHSFQFAVADRERIRHQLSIPSEAVVGIYVGKYGGLYYQEEAFRIYRECFTLIPDFRLIILSPQPGQEIMQLLHQVQIDHTKVYVASVAHHEVPPYLSAADFAFATIKSYPSARYCSPVKIGEYWASGLPVLLTEGVGDDSDIIKHEGGGALFNLSEAGSVEQGIVKIQKLLKDPTHRQQIPELARKYRSPDKIREAYEHFFGKQEEESR